MNLERWSNIVAARRRYDAGGDMAADAPMEAFFEVSARCNLRCQMCAINYDTRYRPRSGRPPFFEPDLFERLRPIFPRLIRAYLFGLGEPLLNRHMPQYIRQLSEAGVESWFNTNATLIDEERAEELARAGAGKITVSIDGASAATYEGIRRGATFEAVIRGIRALVAAGRKYGRPAVDLSLVAMKSNIAELPLMVELCAELGAAGLHVEPLFAQTGSPELDEHYDRENLGLLPAGEVASLFDRAHLRAKELGIRLGTRFTGLRDRFDFTEAARAEKVDWICSEPWSSIWVTSAGEVRTCCMNETSFGNLFEQTFEQIWNGEPFRRFRQQHAKRQPATGCANCAVNGRARNSTFFRATQPVSYRPMFRELPSPSAADRVTFDTPRAGATVTDPLVVSGTIDDVDDSVNLELMIDRTPVANFHASAFFCGRQFAFALPIDFVTEGAHVVWARHAGDDDHHHGWGHRLVYIWRPDVRAREVRVTDDALFAVCTSSWSGAAELRIGGLPWNEVEWKTMESLHGQFAVARAKLEKLPPGTYSAEVVWGGSVLTTQRLQRLPTV